MVSPTKKRKKNPPTTPHKGKTLDDFFGKKSAQSPTPAESRRTGQSSTNTSVQGLNDEEYARQLARQWEEEDQTAAGSEDAGAHAGVKRRRSSSTEREDAELAKKLAVQDQKGEADHAESNAFGHDRAMESRSREKQTPGRTGPINSTYPEPVTPKKKEVSVQTEEDIIRTTESIPLDSDPLAFTPDDYRDLAHSWPDEKATYGLLTRAFVLVNSTRSRIKIVDTLVNLLRTLIRLDPESLLASVWLTTNDIGPPYENNELGIGSSIITKAITGTSGITSAALRKLWHKYGDPGLSVPP
jgi:DNA ligase-1